MAQYLVLSGLAGACFALGMMRSDLVVLQEPSIDYDLSFFGGVEPFSIEYSLSKCSVEVFFLSDLPWVAWID